MTTNPDYAVYREWFVHTAEYHYVLFEFGKRMAHGDAAWAQRNAEHFGIEVTDDPLPPNPNQRFAWEVDSIRGQWDLKAGDYTYRLYMRHVPAPWHELHSEEVACGDRAWAERHAAHYGVEIKDEK